MSLKKIYLESYFPISLGKAPLHLFLSGKMSGSGLYWNCLSICRPECFSPFWFCMWFGYRLVLEQTCLVFAFWVKYSFFSFCLTCIENFKFSFDRGLWLGFDLYYCFFVKCLFYISAYQVQSLKCLKFKYHWYCLSQHTFLIFSIRWEC